MSSADWACQPHWCRHGQAHAKASVSEEQFATSRNHQCNAATNGMHTSCARSEGTAQLSLPSQRCRDWHTSGPSSGQELGLARHSQQRQQQQRQRTRRCGTSAKKDPDLLGASEHDGCCPRLIRPDDDRPRSLPSAEQSHPVNPLPAAASALDLGSEYRAPGHAHVGWHQRAVRGEQVDPTTDGCNPTAGPMCPVEGGLFITSGPALNGRGLASLPCSRGGQGECWEHFRCGCATEFGSASAPEHHQRRCCHQRGGRRFEGWRTSGTLPGCGTQSAPSERIVGQQLPPASKNHFLQKMRQRYAVGAEGRGACGSAGQISRLLGASPPRPPPLPEEGSAVCQEPLPAVSCPVRLAPCCQPELGESSMPVDQQAACNDGSACSRAPSTHPGLPCAAPDSQRSKEGQASSATDGAHVRHVGTDTGPCVALTNSSETLKLKKRPPLSSAEASENGLEELKTKSKTKRVLKGARAGSAYPVRCIEALSTPDPETQTRQQVQHLSAGSESGHGFPHRRNKIDVPLAERLRCARSTRSAVRACRAQRTIQQVPAVLSHSTHLPTGQACTDGAWTTSPQLCGHGSGLHLGPTKLHAPPSVSKPTQSLQPRAPPPSPHDTPVDQRSDTAAPQSGTCNSAAAVGVHPVSPARAGEAPHMDPRPKTEGRLYPAEGGVSFEHSRERINDDGLLKMAGSLAPRECATSEVEPRLTSSCTAGRHEQRAMPDHADPLSAWGMSLEGQRSSILDEWLMDAATRPSSGRTLHHHDNGVSSHVVGTPGTMASHGAVQTRKAPGRRKIRTEILLGHVPVEPCGPAAGATDDSVDVRRSRPTSDEERAPVRLDCSSSSSDCTVGRGQLWRPAARRAPTGKLKRTRTTAAAEPAAAAARPTAAAAEPQSGNCEEAATRATMHIGLAKVASSCASRGSSCTRAEAGVAGAVGSSAPGPGPDPGKDHSCVVTAAMTGSPIAIVACSGSPHQQQQQQHQETGAVGGGGSAPCTRPQSTATKIIPSGGSFGGPCPDTATPVAGPRTAAATSSASTTASQSSPLLRHGAAAASALPASQLAAPGGAVALSSTVEQQQERSCSAGMPVCTDAMLRSARGGTDDGADVTGSAGDNVSSWLSSRQACHRRFRPHPLGKTPDEGTDMQHHSSYSAVHSGRTVSSSAGLAPAPTPTRSAGFARAAARPNVQDLNTSGLDPGCVSRSTGVLSSSLQGVQGTSGLDVPLGKQHVTASGGFCGSTWREEEGQQSGGAAVEASQQPLQQRTADCSAADSEAAVPDPQQVACSSNLPDPPCSCEGILSRKEVEEQEWMRRQQVIIRQRREAQAAKEARRRQVECSRRLAAERTAHEVAVERRERLRGDVRKWLAGLLPQCMAARTALTALSFPVPPGPSGLRSAMKKARAFYHPDAASRRGLSEKELVKCEEIFKMLGSLAPI